LSPVAVDSRTLKLELESVRAGSARESLAIARLSAFLLSRHEERGSSAAVEDATAAGLSAAEPLLEPRVDPVPAADSSLAVDSDGTTAQPARKQRPAAPAADIQRN